MHMIHLFDLPHQEFSVKFNKKHLDTLREIIKKRFHNIRKFIPSIQDCSSFKNNMAGSLEARVYKILTNNSYIPLDFLIKLSQLLNIDSKEIEKHVVLLANNRYAKKPISISFPFVIDNEFARICEIIRTEGYLSKDLQITLSNSDMRIINKFIDSFKIFSLKKEDFYFRLYTKIAIPNYVKKEDIHIYDVTKRRKIKNFSVRIKLLKEGKKKEIHIYDPNLGASKKKYRVIIPTRTIICTVDFSEDNPIHSYSSYIGGKGKNITSSLCVTLSSNVIGKLMHYVGEIPLGRKSHKIRLPKFILEGNRSLIGATFEEAINCDGHIEKYQIKLKSISKEYLEDWKKTLNEKFGIKSTIRKYDLVITHKENFKKMANNFVFLPEKNEKLKNMASGKIVLHPRTALQHYRSLIEQSGPLKVTELAHMTGKTTSCIKKIMKELFEKDRVDRERIDSRGTYLYMGKHLNE